MPERIGFIGAGKLATGLAMALSVRGYSIEAVASRSSESARRLASLLPETNAVPSAGEVADACDVVFITTPDNVIQEVARSVRWRPGQGVIHCSGALSVDALGSASGCGASVASFHPLQTLACIETPQEAAERLSGICYAVEADGWLADWLEKLSADLGGYTISVASEDRALYHQAAVFACGYVTALLDAAEEMWTRMGFSPQQARMAIGALAQTTVTNYRRVGSAASVTGPIPRGDVKTVRGQMDALGVQLPALVPLARELGLRSLLFAPAEDREALVDVLQPLVTPTPDRETR